MKDFIDKLQDFLFDIIGLAVPGFLFIILLVSPYYIISFPIDPAEAKGVIGIFVWVKECLTQLKDSEYFLLLGFLLSYILGHFVKVFSIIFYDLCRVVFDNGINKIFNWIDGAILSSQKLQKVKKNAAVKWFYNLYLLFKSLLRQLFEFDTQDYLKENENLRKKAIDLINTRLSENFPDAWHSLYNISTAMMVQENIKSLAPTFLAKYNLYRSLSFIFIFSFFYSLFFFTTYHDTIVAEAKVLENYVPICLVLLWFVFHVKFKRYWTLCGNETLMSLYYFLNKKKIADA